MANDFSGGCFKESYNSYCDYNNKYHELCRLYKAPVGNYKNDHCWKCNTKNSSHIATKEFKYCDNPRCAFGADCILSPDPPVVPHFRWSLLINFSGKSKFSVDGLGSSPNCQNRTIYVVETSKCVVFICPKTTTQ